MADHQDCEKTNFKTIWLPESKLARSHNMEAEKQEVVPAVEKYLHYIYVDTNFM